MSGVHGQKKRGCRMFDLDSPLLLVSIVVALALGAIIYGRFFGGSKVTLEDMMSDIGVVPDAVLQSEADDVALCWVQAGEYFVYLNTLSGTKRKIGLDEIHALDVQENNLTIRHQVDALQKKDMAEEIADGINRHLPTQLQDKIERLEIVMKTKTGGPPMGYSIPIVESETSPSSREYKGLRNNVVEAVDNWRNQIGLK